MLACLHPSGAQQGRGRFLSSDCSLPAGHLCKNVKGGREKMFTAPYVHKAPLPKARALLPMLCPWGGSFRTTHTRSGYRVVGVSPGLLQSVVGTRVLLHM